jgi:hypothetical protein
VFGVFGQHKRTSKKNGDGLRGAVATAMDEMGDRISLKEVRQRAEEILGTNLLAAKAKIKELVEEIIDVRARAEAGETGTKEVKSESVDASAKGTPLRSRSGTTGTSGVASQVFPSHYYQLSACPVCMSSLSLDSCSLVK